MLDEVEVQPRYLTEIDLEAEREGLAISKLKRRDGKGKVDPREVVRNLPKEEDVDILRILNIIDGRRV